MALFKRKTAIKWQFSIENQRKKVPKNGTYRFFFSKSTKKWHLSISNSTISGTSQIDFPRFFAVISALGYPSRGTINHINSTTSMH